MNAIDPPAGPLVFLDKDGTLIEDLPYNADPDRIRLARGAAEGLRLLDRAGYRLVVVTNQSGVAQGMFPESALADVEARLRALLARLGAALHGFYYCAHDPLGTVPPYNRSCLCRKPAPGLLHRSAAELDADLTAAWIVGDILDDIEAGRRAGCRAVLIHNGNETEWRRGRYRAPHYTVADLHEAARVILERDGAEARRRAERGTRAPGGPEREAG